MYLLLLIFCTCGHISNADDNSDGDEGKFIDLLPKEEKDAFIESVARRLINGVKTKDSRYKSDEEVSDETLNQHSEYVQKVLQEESGNLRRNSKIKKDSDEKFMDQGVDKNNNPTKIQDDEAKDHIDLTLRQGHRIKRNEKTFNVDVDNEEIIPVKVVYDNEHDRNAKNESITKDGGDGNENTRTKSKERLGENSGTEDIQVRGLKSHSRSLRRTKTEALNFQDSPKDATMIVDFEPEENQKTSNENHAYSTTDSVGHRKTESTTVQDVIISSETTDDVESSHKGFTEPIFEPQQSDNEEGKSSNESIETVTNKASTVKIADELAPEKATTTAKNVGETSTIRNLAQNTTRKKKYLRDNLDNVNLNKESENRSVETEKLKNNSSEISEPKIIRRNTSEYVTTSKVDDVMRNSGVQDNEHFDSLSINKNLLTENKNNASNEHDKVLNNKTNDSNEDNFYNTSKTVDKDVVVSNIDTTITNAFPNGGLEKKENLVDISQKNNSDVNNDNVLKKGKETNEGTKKSAKLSEDKGGNDEPSDIKHIAEGRTSTERYNYLTTTEKSEQDSNKLYVTKEVNNSYIPSNVKIIRSDINIETEKKSSNEEFQLEQPIESTQKHIKNIMDDSQYVKFEEVPNYWKTILTTTENNDEINPNVFLPPKYSLYYSSYVPKDENDKEKNVIHYPNEIDKEKNITHHENNEIVEAEGHEWNYYNQSAQQLQLENIAKALRQRLSQDQYDLSEKTKPDSLQSRGKVKEYLVYEIPADESPFVPVKPELELQLESEPKEQPYYVPVYNYAPSNAYYNAYNRLGPNDGDNDEEGTANFYERDRNSYDSFEPKSNEHFLKTYRLPDGHRKFKFNTKKKPSEYFNKLKVRQNSVLPMVVKKPKFTEIYFNPDEYLDMDYYFERPNDKPIFRTRNKRKLKKRTKSKSFGGGGGSFFPNSDEEGHPYNSMAKKKVNNHINAVRQMMFQQKQFGYHPITTTPKSDDEYENATTNNDHNNNSFDIDDAPDPLKLRTRNHSDYIILLSNGKYRSDDPDQQDISIDYYFGLYNTGKFPDGNRYGSFQKERRDAKIKVSDFIGEIRRLLNKQNAKKKFARNKQQNEDKEKWQKNAGTIKEILEIGEEKDAFVNLKKLEELGLNVMRRQSDEEVQVYVGVLQDMVKMENRALKNFDWLGSTVDILGAVEKLKYLTELKQVRQEIDPEDLQLLNYVTYLFKISKSSLDDMDETLREITKSKKGPLPRNKHRKKEYLTSGLLNRVWLIRQKQQIPSSEKSQKELDFFKFLDDLKNSLHGLHNSLKHIAMITDFKNQQWFTNLKLLYLKNMEQKVILELLLHIFTSRLLELIEKSAKNGLEDGYLQYVEMNEPEVEKTKEEFVFVLKLLKEIENLNN